MEKLKVLELFAGIGACSKALERLNIPHEIVDAVEIDKYAIQSFNAIHGTNFEPQDITTWDKDIEVDLIMHGSPCQDFSLAGKQAGGDKDSGTRSSLMYETIRIVEKLKPKYVIWENVKNLLSKKHRHNFDAYLETLKQLGYKNYYQVLNAKDYGIPQNRERVFTISIRKDVIVYDDYNSNVRNDQDTIGTLTTNCGSSTIRNGWKIIEHNQHFEFPPKQELKLRLKDMLESEVDEKYNLSEKLVNCFMSNGTGKYPRRERFLQNINRKNQDVANAIITTEGNKPTCNFIKKPLCLNSKGGRNGIEGLQPSLKDRVYDSNGIATCCATSNFFMPNYTDGLRIRKLTEKECLKLMGFDDEDYEKIKSIGISRSQIYKQAGNSIVVNVLEAIFKELFREHIADLDKWSDLD